MKWMKKYEELDTKVYRRAGHNLKYINKSSRGQKLIDYADEKDYGFYNVWWGNSNTLINKNKEPIVFTDPKWDFLYHNFRIDARNTDENARNLLKGWGPEELVQNWYKGESSLSFTINFYFRAAGQSIALHDKFKYDKIPLFSINFQISEWIDMDDFEGSDIKNALDLYQHMNGYDSPQISIQRPLDKYYFGIFSDRKSANKFKRDCLVPAIEEYHDKIFEIFSIIGAPASDYENAIKSFKNVRTNYLYDEYGGGGQGIKRENVWYNSYEYKNHE